MQREMGWSERNPYKYYPEWGPYYHEVWPHVYCGSQPRSQHDIDELAALLGSDGSILSLQQDRDLRHWGVDLLSLQTRASKHHLRYLRQPAQDFDPHSLRSSLPGAVAALDGELRQGRSVYVHCTAGLGRAPAACIAYLYWFQDFQLQSAYDRLTRIRPCGPRWDAIRGATYDLLDGRGWDAFEHLPPESYAELNSRDKQTLQRHLEERHH